ncbi:hypothetical protein [Gordonia sp. NB41Y]|uniref:hypothetical protein n=1 Tax=Gordonia sp. NB41Y TaxID=875808 RepID=UPI0002BD3BFF|nr:hypothetical protein [Gordonia sp. NB41Y]WLP90723.1 hypothetical protein Q9K23_25125 [Gordonia sp. NB41Y]
MTQADTRPAQLPYSVDELTPDWFSTVLTTPDGVIGVTGVDVSRIIWGSATKVFASLEFAVNERDIPSQVCVKGGFDERSRAYGLGPAYELEGNFYRDLAPRFTAEVPASFYSATEHDQGVIVMEDLTARGAEFGQATELWSVDDIATTLEVQAKWHAALWGSSKGERAWLPVGAKAARDAFTVMLSPEVLHPVIERPEVPDLSAGLREDARVRAGFAKLWEHDDAATHTINHGDAHFAQLYRVPGSRRHSSTGRRHASRRWLTTCRTSSGRR